MFFADYLDIDSSISQIKSFDVLFDEFTLLDNVFRKKRYIVLVSQTTAVVKPVKCETI